MKTESFRTGNYRHYKGGLYTALGLAVHHETRAPMVLYVSHTTGTLTVRPLGRVDGDTDAWNDWVEYEGTSVRRFAYLGEQLPQVSNAAVSYVEREDGRILAVWNRRYHGWTMPGGKVEHGETNAMAQARELREETGLETVEATPIYDGPHNSDISADRGRYVVVFRVKARGEPRETEAGCPIRWVTRDEFLAESPFREFYREMFAVIPPG
jgi:ADP-ribose pyrophosphatase YjhB (NUDIX family)